MIAALYKFIKYFYYTIYVGRVKGWNSEYLAQWTSGIIVLAFISLNFYTIPIFIDVVFNVWILPKYLLNGGILAPLSFIAFVAVLHLILNQLVFSKYKSIIKEFETLSEKRKQINNIIVYAYMIFTFGAYLGLGNYKIHQDIKKDNRVEKQKVKITDPKQDSLRNAQMDSTVNKYRKNGQ
jgi:hypothetical protein